MSLQTTLTIEVDADPDNDGQTETGVFEITGGVQGRASYGEEVQVDPVIGGAGATANAIVQDYIFGEQHRRRGIYIDLGDGAHIFDVSFNGWKGSDNQWGDGSGSLPADATGEDPITQMQIFMHYLRTGTTDSLNPARVTFGQYHPNGALDDELYMYIDGPRGNHAPTDNSTFDGTMQMVEVERLDVPIDVIERLGI